MSNLAFDPAAIARWKSLCASSSGYERAVRRAVAAILDRLDTAPRDHRVGAIQFQSTPTMWARIAEVDDGAAWMVIWTTAGDGQRIRIMAIEPAPSR